MSAVIDSLKSTNKEKENKLKLIDDSIMKFKEENNLLTKEIEKIKNEIASRNNDINKLKQSIQQFNQGNTKYENDIKQKIQEKNNSFIRLKEMYDNIKTEIKNNKLDENSKKEYLIKIKEETNKIQKEYQNNFKYYTNKLMNNNIYQDEYIKQCLQKDLIDFNNYIRARIQMISPKVKELITYIQNAVDASIGKDYEVKLYGSHATGLCLPWSDIDVVLCKKNGDDIDTNLYLPLHELYLYIKERNNFKDIKYIGTTTVPLIKIKTKENIGIQSVDISLQDKSHYGIKCVSLVLSFKEEYEVFLPMILALKNILKQANLNDPYKVSNLFI
jgi:predicted nucleotidyltransferase